MNLFFPMLVVGLVTSIHCVAMCGSMVATYAVREQRSGTWVQRLMPHLAYQSAKLVSYVAVGLILGAIGSALDLGGTRGWVTVVAGAFMIFLGLQMTGWIPALRRLSLKPPKFLVRALSANRKKAAQGRGGLATPVTFGLMTGLMPCGPLQGAQVAAAATGSALLGGISMLGFGLGTMPLMLGVGVASGFLGAKFKKRMAVVAALAVIVFGVVMLDRGAVLVGSPVNSATLKQSLLGSGDKAAEAVRQGPDGALLVPLAIENTQFVPSTLQIPAGKRVRIVVDRREDSPCSSQLAIPQLGVLADLKPNGVTEVDLPQAQAGQYALTCGMGMMSGSLVVGGN